MIFWPTQLSLRASISLLVSPRIGAAREVVHVSLGYERSKLISSHSTLASIQHVGVRQIVPPGGVSWRQPCSLTGVPLHNDDVTFCLALKRPPPTLSVL